MTENSYYITLVWYFFIVEVQFLFPIKFSVSINFYFNSNNLQYCCYIISVISCLSNLMKFDNYTKCQHNFSVNFSYFLFQSRDVRCVCIVRIESISTIEINSKKKIQLFYEQFIALYCFSIFFFLILYRIFSKRTKLQ